MSQTTPMVNGVSHKTTTTQGADVDWIAATECEAADNFDYIRFTFGDIHGIPRSKVVTKRHFSSALRDGVGVFSGMLSSGTCYRDVQQKEVTEISNGNAVIKPVQGTLHLLPWAADGKHRVGEILCETFWTPSYLGGVHQAACPRYVAENQLRRLAKHGYQLLSGFEAEFIVCDERCRPLFKSCVPHSNLVMSEYESFFYSMEHNLSIAGVDVGAFEVEDSAGQFEFVLWPKRGMESADQMFVLKEAVKEVCQSKGWTATFMSKPFVDVHGNGLHFNHSVWSTSEATNVFHDLTKPGGLSESGRHWIAGLLKHGRALTALCCPTVNCYRRLHFRSTPSRADWGFDNRSTMIRAKAGETGESTYVENRLPGGCANPYIVMAATLAAGLDGLVNRIHCPPAVTPAALNGSAAEEGGRSGAAVSTCLPRDLPEALDALEHDSVLTEALGEEFIRWFVTLKREGEMKIINSSVDEQVKIDKEHELYFKFL